MNWRFFCIQKSGVKWSYYSFLLYKKDLKFTLKINYILPTIGTASCSAATLRVNVSFTKVPLKQIDIFYSDLVWRMQLIIIPYTHNTNFNLKCLLIEFLLPNLKNQRLNPVFEYKIYLFNLCSHVVNSQR